MIGKIIGGLIGARMAERQSGGLNRPGGALLGVGAATLARRMSLPAMLAVVAGGYVVKRYMDKREQRTSKPPKVGPSAA